MNRFFASFMAATMLVLFLQGCRQADVKQVEKEDGSSPAGVQTGQESPLPPVGTGAGGMWTGTVMETMDAASYTYVLVDTGEETVWAAAPKFTVAVGDEVSMPRGMPMGSYHSTTLDRDFDMVYFVPGVTVGGQAPPSGIPASAPPPAPAPSAGSPSDEIDFSGLERADGGLTVAEIFTRRTELSGQKVVVRGKVLKFNSQIMGKNWIHLRDGTGEAGADDLTVTTSGTAVKGDTVLVSGTLSVEKDFGAGYKYDVIIEEAEVTVE